MAITVSWEKQSITAARAALLQKYEYILYQKLNKTVEQRTPNFGALISKAAENRHRARENKRWLRAFRKAARFLNDGLEAIRTHNTFSIGTEYIASLIIPKAQTRSASSTATDTISDDRGPDDPDPDPDPERPYLALGIDHKATTPAGPPVPSVLRPFTDPITVKVRHCRYERQQHHTEPQGSDSTPPRG